ncbi:hypothetical protein EI982_09855 [Haloplanus rallus]|jgi:hypothetical protein|uniref:DUF8149 domain-containing protein n=1 Tax=Haloplanus rallus TaxID=1816183 RepID=A0A6B9F6M4_9EURY|nr:MULTISPECIES: hypothetical protein [Haloplanus]QGX95072.1 hypothetical protein EI982_09855 [Haloplanus rallus]
MTSDDDPTVPIVCPDCETTTRVPLTAVADAVASHNENVHDGEEVAAVDPAVVDRLADLVAEDMGLLDDTE